MNSPDSTAAAATGSARSSADKTAGCSSSSASLSQGVLFGKAAKYLTILGAGSENGLRPSMLGSSNMSGADRIAALSASAPARGAPTKPTVLTTTRCLVLRCSTSTVPHCINYGVPVIKQQTILIFPLQL